MRNRVLNQWIVGLSLVGALTWVGCGGGEDAASEEAASQSSTVGEDFSPVLARVGDLEITESYFDYRYENMPPAEKARYTGEGWRERFLQVLLEETLVYEAARQAHYDRLPEVERRLDLLTRRILVGAYYDRKFVQDIEIPEERLREAYEIYKDEWRTPDKVVGHHIQCSSKETIDEVYRRLQDGERFDMLALEYSEDENTRDKGGLLGWFDRDGYILGLGFNQAFSDVAFSLERGVPSEPVHLRDNWHIIMAGARKEGSQQSFEEVRDRVVAKVRPLVAKEQYEQHIRDLTAQLGVQKFGEFQEEDLRTAEQLYRLAAESTNPHAKLHYYKLLVEKYPQHEHADDSLFMVGFLHSEEFGETAAAVAAFHRLEQEYPQSEYIDEARWMSRHTGRAEPELRGDVAPRDPDEVLDRMEEVRGDG